MNNAIRGKSEVEKVERLINELIHEYDMFFKGHEKIEPTRKRDYIKKELLRIQNMRLNNAIIKQRAINLTHKFATFQRKWSQIWMRIENGTYKIDRYKMERNKKLAEKKKSKIDNIEVSSKPNKEAEYNKLLNKYEVTQQLLGVNKKLNKEILKRKLKEQEEILKKKYKVKGIEFKVIVKNGKATIKPIPIK